MGSSAGDNGHDGQLTNLSQSINELEAQQQRIGTGDVNISDSRQDRRRDQNRARKLSLLMPPNSHWILGEGTSSRQSLSCVLAPINRARTLDPMDPLSWIFLSPGSNPQVNRQGLADIDRWFDFEGASAEVADEGADTTAAIGDGLPESAAQQASATAHQSETRDEFATLMGDVSEFFQTGASNAKPVAETQWYPQAQSSPLFSIYPTLKYAPLPSYTKPHEGPDGHISPIAPLSGDPLPELPSRNSPQIVNNDESLSKQQDPSSLPESETPVAAVQGPQLPVSTGATQDEAQMTPNHKLEQTPALLPPQTEDLSTQPKTMQHHTPQPPSTEGKRLLVQEMGTEDRTSLSAIDDDEDSPSPVPFPSLTSAPAAGASPTKSRDNDQSGSPLRRLPQDQNGGDEQLTSPRGDSAEKTTLDAELSKGGPSSAGLVSMEEAAEEEADSDDADAEEATPEPVVEKVKAAPIVEDTEKAAAREETKVAPLVNDTKEAAINEGSKMLPTKGSAEVAVAPNINKLSPTKDVTEDATVEEDKKATSVPVDADLRSDKVKVGQLQSPSKRLTKNSEPEPEKIQSWRDIALPPNRSAADQLEKSQPRTSRSSTSAAPAEAAQVATSKSVTKARNNTLLPDAAAVPKQRKSKRLALNTNEEADGSMPLASLLLQMNTQNPGLNDEKKAELSSSPDPISLLGTLSSSSKPPMARSIGAEPNTQKRKRAPSPIGLDSQAPESAQPSVEGTPDPKQNDGAPKAKRVRLSGRELKELRGDSPATETKGGNSPRKTRQQRAKEEEEKPDAAKAVKRRRSGQ